MSATDGLQLLWSTLACAGVVVVLGGLVLVWLWP
jgi:hypothetical protein